MIVTPNQPAAKVPLLFTDEQTLVVAVGWLLSIAAKFLGSCQRGR